MGRWSRLAAREFLAWLAIPPSKDWLDVGCGTGALTGAILGDANPRSVKGVDPSAEFVAFAREHWPDERAQFEVGDARVLPEPSGSYDAIVAGLVLNFVTEPARAVTELARVARPGATVAAYVWDYADKMELLRYFWDGATALDPGATELDEGRRFAICQPEPLAHLFRSAGLAEVEVRNIDVPTVFRDFDDYWSPFLGGQGPAPGYAVSLNEERQHALRERIRSALPVAEDGSIHLVARAWAVRGLR